MERSRSTHLISLPLILARIKHGREKWISRLWRRLRVQWNISNTKRMAQAMMVVMTRPNTSILYSLVSFEHSTVYNGLVQDRPGTARTTEHSAATSDTNPEELKYRGMKAAGGAAAWYFIPVVGGATVPKRQLETLEMWRLARNQTAGIMQERSTGPSYDNTHPTD